MGKGRTRGTGRGGQGFTWGRQVGIMGMVGVGECPQVGKVGALKDRVNNGEGKVPQGKLHQTTTTTTHRQE